jgi:hypothetical protein
MVVSQKHRAKFSPKAVRHSALKPLTHTTQCERVCKRANMYARNVLLSSTREITHGDVRSAGSSLIRSLTAYRRALEPRMRLNPDGARSAIQCVGRWLRRWHCVERQLRHESYERASCQKIVLLQPACVCEMAKTRYLIREGLKTSSVPSSKLGGKGSRKMRVERACCEPCDPNRPPFVFNNLRRRSMFHLSWLTGPVGMLSAQGALGAAPAHASRPNHNGQSLQRLIPDAASFFDDEQPVATHAEIPGQTAAAGFPGIGAKESLYGHSVYAYNAGCI